MTTDYADLTKRFERKMINPQNWTDARVCLSIRHSRFEIYGNIFEIEFRRGVDDSSWLDVYLLDEYVKRQMKVAVGYYDEASRWWEVFSGERVHDSALSRADEDPFVAAARVVANTI